MVPYQQILNNAQTATGAPLVFFSQLATDSQQVNLTTWAAADPNALDHLLNPLGALSARADRPIIIGTLNASACWRTVYLETKHISVSVESLAGDPPCFDVSGMASTIGVTQALVYPLIAWNHLEGAISFLFADEPDERQHRTCRAFADQASLALENAVLCEVLQVQLEQVQESRRQMTAAEERLRQDIAELLHGKVQNRLLVAWHRLGECENVLDEDRPRALALLREARQLIDTVRESDIRIASHQLHPSAIRMGLIPAVRSLAGSLEGDITITVQVDARLQSIEDPLSDGIPQDSRLAAYRVVEEALNNACRHASPTRVDISLGLSEDNELSVVVRDNGSGFHVPSVKRGLGLNSITGRMETARGILKIDSTVGLGTTISAMFPLEITDTSQS